MGVPPGLAVDEVALLRLVAAENVLDGAGHDVVDARQAVGRRGTFVEDERRMPLARGDAFVECVAGVPFAQDLGGQPCQVETLVLLELHIACCCFARKCKDRKRNSEFTMHNSQFLVGAGDRFAFFSDDKRFASIAKVGTKKRRA